MTRKLFAALLFFAALPGQALAQEYRDASGTVVPRVTAGTSAGVAVTPVVQALSYSASNALGNIQPIAFARSPTMPGGIFTNIWAAWLSGLTTPVTFYIFDTLPAAATCKDKTALSLSNADYSKLAMAPFTITPAATQGATQAIGQYTAAISARNQDNPSTVNLYVCPVVGGTVTPGSTSDFVFKLSPIGD